ncbi:hypothetical protein [Bifidobacterium phasiani]|uniref:Secreted protein n=1 Tax=Bifidobacterium phasiani TaxID=2834431 RepID=A0ABS6WAX2_9BIFI|nr:hypothetical protein [Bifidobacterium phasiani]MBW3083661.1 hypothetical protein [Bifidobacterium phasiani]
MKGAGGVPRKVGRAAVCLVAAASLWCAALPSTAMASTIDEESARRSASARITCPTWLQWLCG